MLTALLFLQFVRIVGGIKVQNTKKTNSHCKALYDRLVEKGKNKKAAIIAVCNKLLKIIFGVIKNQTMYQELTVKNIA